MPIAEIFIVSTAVYFLLMVSGLLVHQRYLLVRYPEPRNDLNDLYMRHFRKAYDIADAPIRRSVLQEEHGEDITTGMMIATAFELQATFPLAACYWLIFALKHHPYFKMS